MMTTQERYTRWKNDYFWLSYLYLGLIFPAIGYFAWIQFEFGLIVLWCTLLILTLIKKRKTDQKDKIFEETKLKGGIQ